LEKYQKRIRGAQARAKKLAIMCAPHWLHRAHERIRIRIARYRGDYTLKDWSRLRRLAARERDDGDATKYEKFLCWADPALALPRLSDATFVGSGKGSWNLATYRAGMVDDQPVFEKVYLADSLSWRKLTWAHAEVFPNLDRTIPTPPLLGYVRGDWLVAAYFPLLSEVRSLPMEETASAAADFQETVSDFRWSGYEAAVRDFRLDPVYRGGRVKLQGILARAGGDPILVDLAEKWAQRPDMPRRFTHGDFNPGNALSCGTILDFDLCGYYPVGYEYGKALGEGYRFASVDEFQAFVDQISDLPGWRARAAALYFAAVFYSSQPEASRAVSEDFVLSLWDRALQSIGGELQGNILRSA
jgi:hypothetical protein